LSALTKIFVVLLVICASLQTAATVVFVNRVENYADAAKTAQAKANDSDRRYRSAVAEVAAATANAEKVEAAAASQIQALRSNLDGLQRQIADRDTQIAKAASDQQTLSLQNTQLAAGLKASEEAKQQLQTTLADARKSSDELV
jgi:chromosome segregation ATPase